MGFIRGAFFFGLVNMFVMISISLLVGVINFFLFGTATPSTQLLPLMVMSCVWGSGGAFISLMISKFMAKKSMGVQVIDPERASGLEKDLITTVYRLAETARLPKMPEVGIYDSPEINAFATGPSKSNSLVAVSSGLLRSMNREQVEGVLAHEVAHIANGDMVILTLIQGIVNSFVIFFSRILASVIAGSQSENGQRRSGGYEFLLVMVLQTVFGLLGNMVICYFSRQREFRADRGGSAYAGQSKMVSALKALQGNRSVRLGPSDDSFASSKIFNLNSGGLMSFFSTHPPLEVRIARLEQQ